MLNLFFIRSPLESVSSFEVTVESLGCGEDLKWVVEVHCIIVTSRESDMCGYLCRAVHAVNFGEVNA